MNTFFSGTSADGLSPKLKGVAKECLAPLITAAVSSNITILLFILTAGHNKDTSTKGVVDCCSFFVPRRKQVTALPFLGGRCLPCRNQQ